MEMWPSMVGQTMAMRTRVFFIDKQRNLVVSVADAATAQELSLLKPQIMSKLMSASAAVGAEIAGLRLDMKHFYDQRTINSGAKACEEQAERNGFCDSEPACNMNKTANPSSASGYK